MLRRLVRSTAVAAATNIKAKRSVTPHIVKLPPVSTDQDVMSPSTEGQQVVFRGIFSPMQPSKDRDIAPVDLVTELASAQQNKCFG